MLKVCYLIFAHHEPQVFHQLIDVIAHEHSDVVVHLDRRSDFRLFARPEQANVHFVEPRLKGYWASWSFTRALITTIRFALKVSDASYFVSLAGTDFPIKSRRHIIQRLAQGYPSNFLNHYPLVPGIWGYGLASRFHLVDYKAKIFDARFNRGKKASALQSALMGLLTQLQQSLNARYAPRDMARFRLYHGSNRWCLNRETLEFVTRYFDSRQSKELRQFLSPATSSDEIFIQTAILNSEFNRYCVAFDATESEEIFRGERKPLPDEKRVYFHYIDWSPERENPAILDESDLDALLESEKLFACKFTQEKSAGLLELLKKTALG